MSHNLQKESIRNCFLCLVILIISSSCIKQLKKREFKDLIGVALQEIVPIRLHTNYRESYSGFYHYSGDDETPVLNGPFRFDFTKIERLDWESPELSTTKIIYQGSFRNGKPEGMISMDLENDDGADIYAKYKISILFAGSAEACEKALFSGIIGYAMPQKEYTFLKPNSCDFSKIADQAWATWTGKTAVK